MKDKVKPESDYAVRYCQSVVARAAGFTARTQWTIELARLEIKS